MLASEPAIAVIAGPGTGKTKTLISRIAYLVEHQGVNPSEITAVTFTNKAAGEMKERLDAHFHSKQITRAMTIGTFHSICLQFLSNQLEAVTLVDEYESLDIAKEVLLSCDLSLSPLPVSPGYFHVEVSYGEGSAIGADGCIPPVSAAPVPDWSSGF